MCNSSGTPAIQGNKPKNTFTPNGEDQHGIENGLVKGCVDCPYARHGKTPKTYFWYCACIGYAGRIHDAFKVLDNCPQSGNSITWGAPELFQAGDIPPVPEMRVLECPVCGDRTGYDPHGVICARGGHASTLMREVA